MTDGAERWEAMDACVFTGIRAGTLSSGRLE